MAKRQPIAFLSYVRSDDAHDEGRITAFRQRLEGEVQMQMGKPFPIFQDRNDIAWGQNWADRITGSLSDVTFLIPTLTPSFFESPACRSEFQTFSLKEKTLGLYRLILPLHYVACDQLGDEYVQGSDEIVDILRSRNWIDWRQLRFKPFSDEQVSAALAKMAEMVKATIKELNAIHIAEAAEPASQPYTAGTADLPPIEEKIGSRAIATPAVIEADEQFDPGYDIPEIQSMAPEEMTIWRAGPPNQYAVYTKRYDEVIEASELADKNQSLKLYSYVTRLASSFKKKHAIVLSSRFSGLENPAPKTPLAITILIDNSGSMRGEKIVHTAAWCLLIVEWMDRLGIPTEVLGYTTRAWKGGQSREAWLAGGKPLNPGRLNDLRHLIYKSFSMTAEVSGPNLSVMAREGLLKENIDGEALLWASSRLQAHKAEHRMMFVFSDGAPVDDSTLSVNRGNLLEDHLKDVIATLSTKIALCAIGIGTDVSKYYTRSKTLWDTNELGIYFLDMLFEDPTFTRQWNRKKA